MVNLRGNPFFLDNCAIQWVEQTLDSLTTEEKVGQLFCVLFHKATEEEATRVFDILHPGSCMYRVVSDENAVSMSNLLRQKSKVPMMIAANLEKGGNGLVETGTLMGSPLEIAATDDANYAGQMATVCAVEGSAVGANWAFAPIVDIDFNFRNPITNVRTFGSDPERVARMAKSYVQELQKRGFAAAVKHFPGDGVDERDQHLLTSVNSLSCEEWMQSYGMVYHTCIEAGTLSVMVGHIQQPAWSKRLNPELEDKDILPASLSPELMVGLLREELGFNGLITTDATPMAGFTMAMSRQEAVPRVIAAGADVFLFTRNIEEDYHYMLDGVKNGVITKRRLDEAVTRILATKAALGLHFEQGMLDLEQAREAIGNELHRKWANECADKAITLVKNEPGVLPLSVERYKRILVCPIEPHASAPNKPPLGAACADVIEKLKSEGFDVTVFKPDPKLEGYLTPYAKTAQQYDLVLYLADLPTKSNQTVVRIEWEVPMGANCPHFVNDIPTVFVSLENPYHLLDVPRIRTYINCYSDNPACRHQLVEKLMGRSTFKGKSPVDPFCGKWDTRL